LTTVIAAILIPEIAAAAETPRLVVLVSVDQLPARYLTDFRRLFAQDGIFARIESQGACFTNCHHRHAFTLTGPGHSTMMTGADPARTGIIGNAWYDRRSGKTINCVEDAEYPIVGGMSGEKGVSPRNLLAPTVGDTLKLSACPRPKVFGISWKDRAGVLMAGHAADACFWFDEASGNWVTSRYYRQDLPGYLRSFNEGPAARQFAGGRWDLLLDREQYIEVVPDDYPYETNVPFFGRAFPHRFPDDAKGPYFTLLGVSPMANDLTLAAAALIVEHEQLGQDESPDILCVGLSANDYVGHAYGPHSLEVQDILARTDRQLAGFADLIESKLKGAPWVLVICSDHGVGPIPELAASLKVPAARNPLGELDSLQGRLEDRLSRELGALPAGAKWIRKVEPGEVYLNEDLPELYADRFVAAQRIVQQALAQLPVVAEAHTRDELLRVNSASGLLEQFRLTFNAMRSGDVLFVLAPYSIQGSKNAATHGSPWSYDSHVPLLWLGCGIPQLRVSRRVSPAQIGPTISRLLGIDSPAASAVEPLAEITADVTAPCAKNSPADQRKAEIQASDASVDSIHAP
jgi:hypothetical protein